MKKDFPKYSTYCRWSPYTQVQTEGKVSFTASTIPMHTHPWYRLEGATAGGRTRTPSIASISTCDALFQHGMTKKCRIECMGTMDDHPMYRTLLYPSRELKGRGGTLAPASVPGRTFLHRSSMVKFVHRTIRWKKLKLRSK